MIDAVRTAIVSRFNDTPNDFNTAVGGQHLAYVQAARSWNAPYAVFSFPPGFHSANTFDARIEESEAQFNCFSITSDGAADIAKKCGAHYHRVTLSASGIKNFRMTRRGSGLPPMPVNKNDEASLWMAVVIFEFMVQEAS